MVDGATRLQALLRIVLPIAVPGLVCAVLFAFTLSWNEFIYALTFTSSSEEITASVGVTPRTARSRSTPARTSARTFRLTSRPSRIKRARARAGSPTPAPCRDRW